MFPVIIEILINHWSMNNVQDCLIVEISTFLLTFGNKINIKLSRIIQILTQIVQSVFL